MERHVKERFLYCLTETKDYEKMAFHVMAEFKLQELQDVIQYLLEKFEDEPDLLNQFWNHKSDACPLEASEMEEQVGSFRGWVMKRNLTSQI